MWNGIVARGLLQSLHVADDAIEANGEQPLVLAMFFLQVDAKQGCSSGS